MLDVTHKKKKTRSAESQNSGRLYVHRRLTFNLASNEKMLKSRMYGSEILSAGFLMTWMLEARTWKVKSQALNVEANIR